MSSTILLVATTSDVKPNKRGVRSRELVLDTMQGSAAFALGSGRHVAELRDMVTSPGGTSAEALYQLEKGGLRTVVSDAVWVTCALRSPVP